MCTRPMVQLTMNMFHCELYTIIVWRKSLPGLPMIEFLGLPHVCARNSAAAQCILCAVWWDKPCVPCVPCVPCAMCAALVWSLVCSWCQVASFACSLIWCRSMSVESSLCRFSFVFSPALQSADLFSLALCVVSSLCTLIVWGFVCSLSRTCCRFVFG